MNEAANGAVLFSLQGNFVLDRCRRLSLLIESLYSALTLLLVEQPLAGRLAPLGKY